MNLGDFTNLAENYSKYRPGYSINVLNSILGLLEKSPKDSVFVDVGAGTGIWTRLVSGKDFKSVYAIEPNEAMRNQGEIDSRNLNIVWKEGSGESVPLEDNSADLLTMASSFHWVNFEKGLAEFNRVLKKNGVFVAIWNPRVTRETQLLSSIEDYLYSLKPDMKRVSSGNSEFTNSLYDRLWKNEFFQDVVYLESKNKVIMKKEEYLGVWKSVNDIRAQLGEELFQKFLNHIDDVLTDKNEIEVFYLTRAWCAIKK